MHVYSIQQMCSVIDFLGNPLPDNQGSECFRFLRNVIVDPNVEFGCICYFCDIATEKIVFQWVPSHCGLWGNERAYFLAKKGTGILQNFRRDLTLHSAKLEIKRIFRESFRLTASRVARDKPWSTLLTSPICVLCDTGQDMTAAHLDECSALNDLNCIVKGIGEPVA
ncbi:hypothetical protein TNCV_366081 [Trichonephila clavipes]|nr:hypothetical protein TNCV_366081 [Trichonephila clavipes]